MIIIQEERKLLMRNPIITIILLALMMYTGCGSSGKAPETATNNKGEKNPLVTLTMENGKQITIELYPAVAPNSVYNFISLIKKGFYDGVIFHRVIPGFMIQGGDPLGTGQGGPGYKIFGEFSNNKHENNLQHKRGVLSMARQGNPYDPESAYNTAGSQFFIMVADAPHLDGDYAAFGMVLSGLDVVDQIVGEKRDNNDKPLNDQKIKTMTVETFGVEYPEPETISE